MTLWRNMLAGVVALLLASCAPLEQELGQQASALPQLGETGAVMDDGVTLPLRIWKAKRPTAIIVAVHGFNDYSNSFKAPAAWFASQNVTTYAYDQRSFGKNKQRGIWAGSKVMAQDLRTFVRLVKQRHPKLPLYVAGVSMGGAVTMRALGQGGLQQVDGVVLLAPAVWGWRSMNMFYRASLWTAAHVSPGSKATGSGLDIWPSDNIEMLRALGKDKLMIRDTRIDTIYGLVTLMDEAHDAAVKIKKPVLYLYGAKDQLVPAKPTFKIINTIRSPKRVVYYKNGWHMLLRDKQAKRVWQDILAWVRDQNAVLPSGEEIAQTRVTSAAQTIVRADK